MEAKTKVINLATKYPIAAFQLWLARRGEPDLKTEVTERTDSARHTFSVGNALRGVP
jgi:hypothetical protein